MLEFILRSFTALNAVIVKSLQAFDYVCEIKPVCIFDANLSMVWNSSSAYIRKHETLA